MKLRSIDEMRADPAKWQHLFSASFDVPEQARSALRGYMAAVKPSGTISQHMQAHMNAYWRWIDSGQAMADVQTKRQADRTQPQRQREYQRMAHMLSNLARTPAGRGATLSAGGSTSQMAAPASPQVATFFSNHVHDSFEHFSATGGTLQTDLSNADYYNLRQLNRPVG